MESKVQYKRLFFIFSREDAGFGSTQEPSGYAKIEVKDGKGKLHATVQNLKEVEGQTCYKLYILKHEEKKTYPVVIGEITMQKNRGELEWEFEPGNVASTGIPIDQFNIVAVLVEYKDRENNTITCPLAAYKDKKLNWREQAKAQIYSLRNEQIQKLVTESANKTINAVKPGNTSEKVIEAQVGLGKYTDEELESKYTASRQNFANQLVDEREKSLHEDNQSALMQTPTQEAVTFKQDMEPDRPDKTDEDGFKAENSMQQENSIEDKRMEMTQDTMANMYPGMEDYGYPNGTVNETKSEPEKNTPNYTYNNNYYTPPSSGYNPCSDCVPNSHKQEDSRDGKKDGDIEKLRESLNKYFEPYNPFGIRRGNYKWWKISSPVYLNNILYQCNIKTPLLFNPKVLMAHFKYRHLIAGIYIDRIRRREYIVFGVPGVYGLDENPFGEMCRWVQLEGYKPKYGAFGYWLVYIEPKTGKLLKVN
ncbi:MAG: hypothetical protein N3B21_17350 [Clostridia bacterium]|nr:hypothetical protein [Clostridia bacterium]